MSHHRVMIRVLMVVNAMFVVRSSNMSSVVGSMVGGVRSGVVGSVGSGMVGGVVHVGVGVIRGGCGMVRSGSGVVGGGSGMVGSGGRVVRSGFGMHVGIMMGGLVDGVDRVVGSMVSSVMRHVIGWLLELFQGS